MPHVVLNKNGVAFRPNPYTIVELDCGSATAITATTAALPACFFFFFCTSRRLCGFIGDRFSAAAAATAEVLKHSKALASQLEKQQLATAAERRAFEEALAEAKAEASAATAAAAAATAAAAGDTSGGSAAAAAGASAGSSSAHDSRGGGGGGGGRGGMVHGRGLPREPRRVDGGAVAWVRQLRGCHPLTQACDPSCVADQRQTITTPQHKLLGIRPFARGGLFFFLILLRLLLAFRAFHPSYFTLPYVFADNLKGASQRPAVL